MPKRTVGIKADQDLDRALIKSLIDALEASDLAELEFSQAGSTLRLVKGAASGSNAGPAQHRLLPTVTAAPAIDGLTEFTSPLYGVVHLRPRPEAAPYVAVGDTVVAGQTLCTVEAMKAFTELRAEADGTVQAVRVETGQDVEAGQILFQLSR